MLLLLEALDLRPPRDASPPFLPATRASSLVNSCAVPFWCAARPPFAAIARCACGSIAANPRGVLRLTLLVFLESTPLSFRFPLMPLLPPPAPLFPLRSSILSPWLLGWSAIIDLPAAIFEFELDAVAGLHRVSGDSVRARPRLRGALMRKQQAAISGRGRTAGHPSEIVDFFTSLTCVTPYLTGTVFWEPSRAGARQRVWRVLSTLAAAPQPLRRR